MQREQIKVTQVVTRADRVRNSTPHPPPPFNEIIWDGLPDIATLWYLRLHANVFNLLVCAYSNNCLYIYII